MRESVIHKRASFLRDAVFAASDGIVTTFAIVAGSQGANLGFEVVIVLGFANLFADGISMASGTYLGVKSEMEFEKAEGDNHFPDASPIKQALVTFFSFGLAGLFPLLPYIIQIEGKFALSILLVGVLLFFVGSLRGMFTKKSCFRSGVEMFFIGGLAAFLAYIVGDVVEGII